MSYKIKAVKPTLDTDVLNHSHLKELNQIANEMTAMTDKMEDDNKKLSEILDEYAEMEQLRKL